MAYQDIDRWQQMSKDELYQELVKIHGDDTPAIDEIVYIYVNNCYELTGQLCEGYPSDCFKMLYPANARKTTPTDSGFFPLTRPYKTRWSIEVERYET